MIAHAVAFDAINSIVWAVPAYLFAQGKTGEEFAQPFIVNKNKILPEFEQAYSFIMKDKKFNGEFCRGELIDAVANNY